MTMKDEIEPEDLTAKEIINDWSEKDLADTIWKYGEERFSRKIARNIVRRREEKAIETTLELVDAIRESVPPFYRNSRKINCATRTFQALRIAVNDELGAGRRIAKSVELFAGKRKTGGNLLSFFGRQNCEKLFQRAGGERRRKNNYEKAARGDGRRKK